MYTSEIYKDVNFIDYFAICQINEDELIGKIRLFFTQGGDDEQYFIFEQYRVHSKKDQFRTVSSDKKIAIYPVSITKQKLIYVCFKSPLKSLEAIVQVPNTYDTN